MKPEETTASTVEPSTEPSAHEVPVYSILGVLGLAVLASLLVRRISRVAVANRVRRWFPLVHVTIWGVATLFIAFSYASSLPDYWMAVVGILIVAALLASVGWLRSVASGIAIALEANLSIGDAIRVGEIEGEISEFSLRSVRLRSVDGTVHEVPNEKFMQESVANLSGDGGDSACEISLRIPGHVEPESALTLARNAAVLTPLASPRHKPEVFLDTSGEREESFEVRIRGYAFDPAYQDHYRSDVISRFHSEYRLANSRQESGEITTSSGLVLVDE